MNSPYVPENVDWEKLMEYAHENPTTTLGEIIKQHPELVPDAPKVN